jgi:hypothetical protein
MKGLRIFLLLVIFNINAAFSQEVISTSGGNFGVNSITIGELAITTIVNSNFILSQGFLQPNFSPLNIIVSPNFPMKVYPIPTVDYLTLELFSKNPEYFSSKIIDNLGRVVFESQNLSQKNNFNISNLIVGEYYLVVKDNFGNTNSFKILKF